MLPVWGAYIWRGLYVEGLIFGILRYSGFDLFGRIVLIKVKFSLRREWPGRSVLTNGKHLKIP